MCSYNYRNFKQLYESFSPLIDLDVTSGVVVAIIFSEDEVVEANPCKRIMHGAIVNF